jgi:hypothetical protein
MPVEVPDFSGDQVRHDGIRPVSFVIPAKAGIQNPRLLCAYKSLNLGFNKVT